MVNRRDIRPAMALVDIIVGVVLLGLVVVSFMALLSRSVNAQLMGEQMQTAAMLLDEQLNLVLARGPDDYGSRFPLEGNCETPFDAYRFQLKFAEGSGGTPYRVTATVLWFSAGAVRSESIEALIAPRLGDDVDPIRQPDAIIERTVQ